jgi:hypothetical protein
VYVFLVVWTGSGRGVVPWPPLGPTFGFDAPIPARTLRVILVNIFRSAGQTVGNILSIIVAGALAALAGTAIAVALRPIRAARRAEQLARIQRDFHRQREQLEAKFIDRAAATGKPRGLAWTNVAFDDDVIYVRDRRDRTLKALVAIEVSFEAVEGGGREDVEAVSNVRAATAEFLYDGTRWCTAGRVYFNLAPSAAVKYLSADMELVAEEHAAERT